MPVYEYRALDVRGKNLKGIIDAESVFAARQRLRETNIFPVDLKETSVEEKNKVPTGRSISDLFNRVGLQEVSVMTRQLATLLGASLPLVPSLTALISQTTNPRLKKTLAQIKEDVNEGNSFAWSISHYPGIFSTFYINMVRAGEASGTLDIVLERLADFNESQQALRGKIKAALAYPMFMFLIGSIVLFFLTTFIVPKITGIFSEMHQTLPGITILLISISGFLKSFWLEKMLYKVSDSLETEVESNITMMTSMLEPVMILTMGLLVGFIVISILLPIFEMNQLIR